MSFEPIHGIEADCAATRHASSPGSRPAIAVRGVSKVYTTHDSRRERILGALLPSRKCGRPVAALSDISFEIARGEAVAIIGRNGSGKSTLLQVLTGTLTPSEGEVEVNGRVSALLELGSGFNPEYTGRENAILNGLLLGFTRQEMLDRMAKIEAFAEIGPAIDHPIKTYSSGMVVRLAFAVQAMSEPDILIVDEALSVGDFFFQQKCFQHITKLRERGVTLLFVSHDMGAVRDVCERAIVLREGRMAFNGPNLEGIRLYLGASSDPSPSEPAVEDVAYIRPHNSSATIKEPFWSATDCETRTGSLRAIIPAVGIADLDGNPVAGVRMGTVARFQIEYRAVRSGPVHFALEFKSKNNALVTSLGSLQLGLDALQAQSGDTGIFEFAVQMSFEAGEYVFCAYLVEPSQDRQTGLILDQTGWIGPIKIDWDYINETPAFFGLFGPNVEARLLDE